MKWRYEKLEIEKLKPKRRCAYCRSSKDLTYDHKIPRIKGGLSDIKNIQVLCERCNTMKSDISHNHLYKLRKWFVEVDIEREKNGAQPKLSKIYNKLKGGDNY